MDFEDLPEGWAQRPITDPDVFEGVVDLIVTEASRSMGALYLLLCHADGRLLQPVAVDDFPGGNPIGWIRDSFGGLFGELREQGVPAVVLAVARWGEAALDERDAEVRDALVEAAAVGGLAVLGYAVAVPGAILSFPRASGEGRLTA